MPLLVHTPATHASLSVQALPSVHGLPSGLAGFEQPVTGLQTPPLWHWSIGVHTRGLPPVHTPLWQVSPCVQGLPSSHAEPLGLGTSAEHMPLAGLHVPARWHWSVGHT